MARYIDADALIEAMDKRYKEKKDIVPNNLAEGFVQMERLIREQPTAYDVDAVVAELEKEQEKLETDMWARESNNWYGQYCNGVSEGYENAIDIVRNAGKDGAE